jgi:uncharacterized cupredoxin-like copper-binding protein
MHYPKATTSLVGLTLLLAACGAEATDPTPTLPSPVETTTAMDDMATGTTMNMEHADDEHTFTFGEPAEESAATRIIDVATLDTFRFEPDPISVKVGETVTFRVTNDGVIPHDVVLDGQAGQDTHEQEMQEMTAEENTTMMMDEVNGFSLAAGESKVLTWTFTEPGTIYLGCHQPGHFAAGMVASVIVEP